MRGTRGCGGKKHHYLIESCGLEGSAYYLEYPAPELVKPSTPAAASQADYPIHFFLDPLTQIYLTTRLVFRESPFFKEVLIRQAARTCVATRTGTGHWQKK